MPLISVIIPLYNSEKTIRETIESVLNQTFSDFEVILINDGSQDSTLDIVSSIQDSRLKIFSYPNAGISTSRNRGISYTSGEFIAFLDHDDLWTPDKLESQLKALQENPQAAVAYSWNNFIDESSQFIRKGARTSVTGSAYEKLLVSNFLETASNPLIRKEALIQVGGFDESVSGPEDWDLFVRLAAHYHFVEVPHSQVLYRMTVSAVSSNVLMMETACLQVIDRAFSQAPKSLQYLKKRRLANFYKYLICKALDGYPRQKKGLVAAKFIWPAVRNDPALLQSRILLKVLFKIAAMILLPPQQAQALLDQFKNLFNTNTLLGYERKTSWVKKVFETLERPLIQP